MNPRLVKGATYWKSQPKHHCEYCDCWIADNKPSRDYHEGGKKHKENKEKKIKELKAKGVSDAKKDDDFEKSMARMEKAAMAALKKDLMSDPNMASQYGVTINKPVLPPAPEPTAPPDPKPAMPVPTEDIPLPAGPITSSGEDSNPEASTEDTTQEAATEESTQGGATGGASGDPSLWQETRSDEGYTYYWHTVTQEVTWTKPEGFVTEEEKIRGIYSVKRESPSEQELLRAKKIKLACHAKPTEPQTDQSEAEEPESSQPTGEPETKETVNSQPIEKLETKPKSYTPIEGPMNRKQTYGNWESVKTEVAPAVVDLQLPAVEKKPEPIVPVQEAKMKFREKVVPAFSKPRLFDKGNAEFKKRKLRAALNIRSRTDD